MLRIPTTVEVYRAILDRHFHDLSVFSSFSNPDGTAFGGGGQEGRMETKWGFKGSVLPCLEAQSTWDIEWEVKFGQFIACRKNEVHLYWMLVPTQRDIDALQD